MCFAQAKCFHLACLNAQIPTQLLPRHTTVRHHSPVGLHPSQPRFPYILLCIGTTWGNSTGEGMHSSPLCGGRAAEREDGRAAETAQTNVTREAERSRQREAFEGCFTFSVHLLPCIWWWGRLLLREELQMLNWPMQNCRRRQRRTPNRFTHCHGVMRRTFSTP